MHLELRTAQAPPSLFVGSIAALVASAPTPQLLGDRVADAFHGLAAASRRLALARRPRVRRRAGGIGCAWPSALRRCGGDDDARRRERALLHRLARERARAGQARQRRSLRALRARAPGEGRLWTAGGVAASIGAVALIWLAVLLAFGSASGALPRWPLALLALGGRDARSQSPGARATAARHAFAHALDAFRVLGRCPRAAAQIVGWVGLAMATARSEPRRRSRPPSASSVRSPRRCSSFPRSISRGSFRSRPGNIGVASAAVAFALNAHGVGSDVALSAGIAFSAVETLTTLAFGSGSLLYFAAGSAGCPPLADGSRRRDGLPRAGRRVWRDRRSARLARGNGARERLRERSRSGVANDASARRLPPGRSPCTRMARSSASGSCRLDGHSRFPEPTT